MQDRYLNPHQAQTRAPTSYENQLGDAIEDAFAKGIHDLDGLVQALNLAGVKDTQGQAWTAKSYAEQIKTLAHMNTIGV